MRESYPPWRIAGYALIGFFIALLGMLWVLHRNGPAASRWACMKISRISPATGANMEKKLRALAEGLHAIRDLTSFAQLSLISIAIWLLVALAYRFVTHAYPVESGLPNLNLPEVVLLMAASIAGGVVQLPLVGGGSQLATIGVLLADSPKGFGYTDAPELAVSCGILLWLVTFMSVVPLGLVLAHRERLSLRRLSQESEAEVESEETAGPSLPIP